MPELEGIVSKQETRKVNRQRVETVVETLTALGGKGESLSEVAHDARNMVTALSLYCDLLEEPGVLALPFLHYGQELRLVAAASRRLVEKLVALDSRQTEGSVPARPRGPEQGAETRPASLNGNGGAAGGFERDSIEKRRPGGRWEWLPGAPIPNFAAELLANRNLLSALAGPAIALTVETAGGAQPVLLTAEDLTRILVNLVRNSSEAMPSGGRIHIHLSDRPAVGGAAASVALAVEDNGQGISTDALQAVFTAGYTTRGRTEGKGSRWPSPHRGLGLAITRSIVEGAGGRISAANREPHGTSIEIELPVQRDGTQLRSAAS